MTKVLLLLPALLVACADAPGELAPPTSAPIAFTTLGDAAIVATGGYQTVAIPDLASAGLSGTASDGFEVEPFGGAWPAMIKPEYHVRALAAGTGDFAIATSHGVARGAIASADVARVALLPADYALDGHSPFVVDPSRPELEIALYDGADRRLVDGSLRVTGQSAWDRVAIAASTTLAISGDSFAPIALPVVVADGVGDGFDRIETITAAGRTCLHAYRGDVEVVTARAVAAAPSPEAANCW